MAGRPQINKAEDVLSREHLKQLGEHLSRLSPHAVLDFYQRAYRDCRIINSNTLPHSARRARPCPGMEAIAEVEEVNFFLVLWGDAVDMWSARRF